MQYNKKRPDKAFTLLEMIIVIIIVGVLASLAIPRLFGAIELSRSNEALNMLNVVKRAFERCSLLHEKPGGDPSGCMDFDSLGINDPNSTPNRHFDYDFLTPMPADAFIFIATRNTVNGGDGVSTITINIDVPGNSFTIMGVGKFESVRYP